ncbi:hypothetical protein COU89_01030 [Candidatus Roizmanbacteria bacterium CG10_big_fil_rev_8_21_14_0_10_45_7]|uniref:DUF1761 domain-containing protein n=1 Tax=Candidatus Roizmanbacteria bacterium CG10_big_fil_rev_8_21_14_0_10_45_7 TaxID=1974854 RepID=A0A2M8KVB4_9BACT|nr:MAG: hypothetical protein COU89_01030 [Candidatus Roizmanbacteria bacterium CG10_big_fil_rev_8_21_14_0_10_45_7]
MEYLAVLFAAILNMIIVYVWFLKKTNPQKMGRIYGACFIAGLMVAAVLQRLIFGITDPGFLNGAFTGFILGFGIVLLAALPHYLFLKRPLKAWLIDFGYPAVSLTLMGGLLGLFY